MTYKVLSRLRHDGTVFEAGETMDSSLLNEQDAKALVSDGVLQVVDSEAPQQPASEQTPPQEEAPQHVPEPGLPPQPQTQVAPKPQPTPEQIHNDMSQIQ
jgi:outer membrane biosynthesis protein TonB